MNLNGCSPLQIHMKKPVYIWFTMGQSGITVNIDWCFLYMNNMEAQQWSVKGRYAVHVPLIIFASMDIVWLLTLLLVEYMIATALYHCWLWQSDHQAIQDLWIDMPSYHSLLQGKTIFHIYFFPFQFTMTVEHWEQNRIKG